MIGGGPGQVGADLAAGCRLAGALRALPTVPKPPVYQKRAESVYLTAPLVLTECCWFTDEFTGFSPVGVSPARLRKAMRRNRLKEMAASWV